MTRSDLFEKWTPSEAWLAGLIWADGCFHEDPGHRAGGYVLLSSVDEELIDLATAITGGRKYAHDQSHRGRRKIFGCRIGAAPAVGRLIAIGLEARKSLTASFPTLPIDGHRHFIRGYFDGDGTVGLYRNPNIHTPAWPARCISGFEAAPEFLAQLQAILEDVGIAPKKPLLNQSIWRVRYNHADSLKLGGFMYGAGGPALTRKRLVFREAARQRPLYVRSSPNQAAALLDAQAWI